MPAILLAGPGRRYLLPLLPALLYWIVLGAGEIGAYLQRRHVAPPARLRRVGLVLLALAVLGNLAHLSKTLYEARSPDFYAVTADGLMLDYFPLTAWLREHAGPRDLVMTGEGNVVRYFSGIRTYQLPDIKTVRRPRVQAYLLRTHHVTYVIVDHTESRPERSLVGLPAVAPRVLERVRTFGKLELFRVHQDRAMTTPAPDAGRRCRQAAPGGLPRGAAAGHARRRLLRGHARGPLRRLLRVPVERGGGARRRCPC